MSERTEVNALSGEVGTIVELQRDWQLESMLGLLGPLEAIGVDLVLGPSDPDDAGADLRRQCLRTGPVLGIADRPCGDPSRIFLLFSLAA